MNKILLIDGNLLLFRSFYAAYSVNKNGQTGNLTTHLFLTSVFEVIQQNNPTHVFIAFDAHAKTKRHQIYDEYKAGRTTPPEEIYQQKKLITKLLELSNIKWYEQAGDEADDLIATLCTKYQDNNQIIIFSEDKDLYQLIDNNIEIIVKDKENKNAYKKINVNNFFKTMELFPNQIVDYKAIAGDSSDNLKGVKGIGHKSAIELLSKYKTLEGIYENINSLTQKQKEKFIESQNSAFLCKKLATLNRLVLMNINLDDLKFSINSLQSKTFIEELKVNNLNRLVAIIEKRNNV